MLERFENRFDSRWPLTFNNVPNIGLSESGLINEVEEILESFSGAYGHYKEEDEAGV